MEHPSEMLKMVTTVYGSDFSISKILLEGMRKLREGTIDTVAPEDIGLSDLTRSLHQRKRTLKCKMQAFYIAQLLVNA